MLLGRAGNNPQTVVQAHSSEEKKEHDSRLSLIDSKPKLRLSVPVCYFQTRIMVEQSMVLMCVLSCTELLHIYLGIYPHTLCLVKYVVLALTYLHPGLSSSPLM